MSQRMRGDFGPRPTDTIIERIKQADGVWQMIDRCRGYRIGDTVAHVSHPTRRFFVTGVVPASAMADDLYHLKAVGPPVKRLCNVRTDHLHAGMRLVGGVATKLQVEGVDRPTDEQIIGVLEAAAAYLDHPEVRAIGFALPPHTCVRNLRNLVRALKHCDQKFTHVGTATGRVCVPAKGRSKRGAKR